jgi:DNA polymerase V
VIPKKIKKALETYVLICYNTNISSKCGETMAKKQYIAIDLKSFYASVECVARGLDPLRTNLVVADISRTEKTICLAVTPSLKSYGISGRARLFEVISRVKQVNSERLSAIGEREFSGSSCDDVELRNNKNLKLDYITAKPRMAEYMRVSTEIYKIYMRYVSPEDVYVYSVDEVFIDVTPYLRTYRVTARELALRMVRDVFEQTGITATAGVGTNMYLCKVAMDIVAKRMPADKDGARIAELDEKTYRYELWNHRPITDFWRVGGGYAKKLGRYGMHTMGDVARCSIANEELLYKLFGVNAELLIDHAWGWEPCSIKDVKSYKPRSRSLSIGQVLAEPYTNDKARLITREMAELLALDLVKKGLVTNQVVLTVGYDIKNVQDKLYTGEVKIDRYGRKIPKHSHGSENLGRYTASSKAVTDAFISLFDSITTPGLYVRRIVVVANNTVYEAAASSSAEQLDLFTMNSKEKYEENREKNIQRTILRLQNRYGKNAVIKGMNLLDGATTVERNAQIGGHKA